MAACCLFTTVTLNSCANDDNAIQSHVLAKKQVQQVTPIHPTQAPLSSQRWLVRLDRLTYFLAEIRNDMIQSLVERHLGLPS